MDAFFQLKLGIYNNNVAVRVAQDANFSSDFVATWNALTQRVDIAINPASTAAGTVAATPDRLVLRDGAGKGYVHGLDVDGVGITNTSGITAAGAVLDLAAGTKVRLSNCQLDANSHSITSVTMMTAVQASGWTFTQPTAAAAPNAQVWRGQSAGTGAFDGGAISWITGAAGGTANLGGSFIVDTGVLASTGGSAGFGGAVSLQNDGVEWLALQQQNDGVNQVAAIVSPLRIQILSGANFETVDSTGVTSWFDVGSTWSVKKTAGASQIAADGSGIVIEAGYLDLLTPIATPAAPSAGMRVYIDSTTLGPMARLASGLTAEVSLGIYGEMYVSGPAAGSTTLTTAGTYYKIAQWTNAGLSNGVTVDVANNQFVIVRAGVYKVDCSMSITGSNNTSFTFKAYVNGSVVGKTGAFATLNASSDAKEATVTGLFSLAVGDTVDFRATADANTKTVTLVYANANIHQV